MYKVDESKLELFRHCKEKIWVHDCLPWKLFFYICEIQVYCRWSKSLPLFKFDYLYMSPLTNYEIICLLNITSDGSISLKTNLQNNQFSQAFFDSIAASYPTLSSSALLLTHPGFLQLLHPSSSLYWLAFPASVLDVTQSPPSYGLPPSHVPEDRFLLYCSISILGF